MIVRHIQHCDCDLKDYPAKLRIDSMHEPMMPLQYESKHQPEINLHRTCDDGDRHEGIKIMGAYDHAMPRLEPKHFAVQNAEKYRGSRCCHEDVEELPSLWHLPPEPEEERKRDEPIAYIPEHESEEQGEGERHEHRGIELIVFRQAIEVGEELKGLKRLWIIELDRGILFITKLLIGDVQGSPSRGMKLFFHMLKRCGRDVAPEEKRFSCGSEAQRRLGLFRFD